MVSLFDRVVRVFFFLLFSFVFASAGKAVLPVDFGFSSRLGVHSYIPSMVALVLRLLETQAFQCAVGSAFGVFDRCA